MKLDILHALNAERDARRAVVVVTDVASGGLRLVKAADVTRDPLRDVIESGKPKMLEFGVADEQAWKVGLSCGGTIRVYVEKVS